MSIACHVHACHVCKTSTDTAYQQRDVRFLIDTSLQVTTTCDPARHHHSVPVTQTTPPHLTPQAYNRTYIWYLVTHERLNVSTPADITAVLSLTRRRSPVLR
jgi:hypothetical protein